MSVRLPPQIELALYRTAQDALDRAIRETHASQVTIRLERNDDLLLLSFSDNGFMVTIDDTLSIARQRIEQLGGSFETTLDQNNHLELAIRLVIQAPIQLTPREMDVVQLLAEGMSNKEIARCLFISPRTVNFHLDNVYSKLGVNSRTEAAIYALRQGWIYRSSSEPG